MREYLETFRPADSRTKNVKLFCQLCNDGMHGFFHEREAIEGHLAKKHQKYDIHQYYMNYIERSDVKNGGLQFTK